MIGKDGAFMFAEAEEHYKKFYYYPLPDGKEPRETVNGLFDAVRNEDGAALEKALRILSSNTYFLVCSRLEKAGFATQDNVDEVIQNVRLVVMAKAHMPRGFQRVTSSEDFFAYLLGITQNQASNFIKNHIPTKRQGDKLARRLIYDMDEKSAFEAMEMQDAEGEQYTPEGDMIRKERHEVNETIFQKFLEVLGDSGCPPRRLLTYCYAVLIPQMAKKTDRKDFIGRIVEMSGRMSDTPNSVYNLAERCWEGEIARKSVKLMKWAYGAMYKLKVAQMNEEFLELYGMEGIASLPFRWGSTFWENMERVAKGEDVAEKELVVTEKYTMSGISNWPDRVAAELLEATRNALHRESGFAEKAVAYFEEITG